MPPVYPVYHLTVSRVFKATQVHSQALFHIDGVAMSKVIVVANVRDASLGPAGKTRTYELIDGTAGILRATEWIVATPGTKERPVGNPFTHLQYVRVLGKLGKFNNTIRLEDISIRPIEDSHEVFHHLLRSMSERLMLLKGLPPPDTWKAPRTEEIHHIAPTCRTLDDQAPSSTAVTHSNHPTTKGPLDPPNRHQIEAQQNAEAGPSTLPLPRKQYVSEYVKSLTSSPQKAVETTRDPFHHLTAVQRDMLICISEETAASDAHAGVYPALHDSVDSSSVDFHRIGGYIKVRHPGLTSDDFSNHLEGLVDREYIIDVSKPEDIPRFVLGYQPRGQKRRD